MKTILFALMLGAPALAGAKPPSPKPTPSVLPAAASPASNSFLHWLLEQDGSLSAIALPAGELLRNVSGQQVVRFDPSNSEDAAIAARIGSILDGLLPELNRPDGSVRLAKRPALVPALVEDELQTALSAVSGLEPSVGMGSDTVALGDANTGTYPFLRLGDQKSHRAYYLGVTFLPTDQKESATPLVRIDPKTAAGLITQPGACLLIILEHNGKTGSQLAFLNWQLIDLQQAAVHARLSFDATSGDFQTPGATIGDGRRGRD